MNKKLFLIAAVVILVTFIIVYSFIALTKRSPSSTTPTNPFSQNGLYGETATTSTKQITLRTTSGTTISVPDFTANHQVIQENNGSYYYLTQDAQGNSQATDYSIVYGTDSSLSIGLLAEPLSQARLHAEAALRKLIPVSNSELCALSFTVMVPQNVNDQYAGQNLGLSFCPGAVQLP